MTAPSIAIVGSGPSGCYMAQALRREWPDAEITVIDRLPVPFGLVRYGVAPDHTGSKAVIRQFERMFERERVNFLGNVTIGEDISLDALRQACDIVVVATGLHCDRKPGLPGEELRHVYGAGQITRFLNDHPDEEAFTPCFGTHPVIIGNGNVAIDILRLLAKQGEEAFQGSEISPEIATFLLNSQVKHIDIVGRSPASAAKFDVVMLKELGKLANVHFTLNDCQEEEADAQSGDRAKVDVVQSLIALETPATTDRSITFHFGWTPVSVEGHDRVTALHLRGTQHPERQQRLPATSVITAIGFEEHAASGMRRDALMGPAPNLAEGYLDEGLYCTGWFRRGPTGTIPENRNDARLVADAIIQAVNRGALSTTKPGLSDLYPGINTQVVRYADWKKINEAELNNIPANRTRQKFRSINSMLQIANNAYAGENEK